MIPDSTLPLPASSALWPVPDWSAVADRLARERHVILPNILPAACWQVLRAEAERLQAGKGFREARIGRAAQVQQEKAIRGDNLCWLEPEMPAGGAYLHWMDGLRETLNRELFLGLAEFEAQYAHYPVGAFYRKHVDRHRDSNARVVSSVLYLNADWPTDAGGELVMFDGSVDDNADTRSCEASTVEQFRLSPQGGTLLLFMSADMPHEVLPATQERWSIAGWFRTRA